VLEVSGISLKLGKGYRVNVGLDSVKCKLVEGELLQSRVRVVEFCEVDCSWVVKGMIEAVMVC
jgi:hypothetical protein